jgi:hypothetical protein
LIQWTIGLLSTAITDSFVLPTAIPARYFRIVALQQETPECYSSSSDHNIGKEFIQL